MNGFIRFVVLAAMIASLTSCVSHSPQDDLAIDDSASLDEKAPVGDSTDEFAEFDGSSAPQKQAKSAPSSGGDQDLAIDDELNAANSDSATPPPTGKQAQAAPAENTEDPFASMDVASSPTPAPAAPEQSPPPPELPPAPVVEQDIAPAPQEPAPQPEQQQQQAAQEAPPAVAPATPSSSPATITDLKFKANENGGTVIVQGNRALTFTTRNNPDLHQFIVEVDNAILPDRLKRSLNTRDIKGSVGAIDAYQNPGSNTARFVIQMREGVSEPAVQAEGNALLIVAGGTAPAEKQGPPPTVEASADEVGNGASDGEGKILPNQNLTEFLAGNNQFYGKKISIETSNMDIRDALNFITEESGVNMVIADEVKGNLSLKLRQVPWDQALVVIMRARKLGYTRQGNVLRIAPLTDLKSEEDDANKLAVARKNTEPLRVRMFPISYAKVDELEKKIKDFLGERGKVVGDLRTNALVVTDIQDNLDRVAKLIGSLDTQPAQVLIEGKIVEAQESFSRQIGVSWNSSGQPIKVGSTSHGPVNMNPRFNINPTANTGTGALNFNLDIGTLDVFGSLSAALALNETENKVKVISSPRILAMTNEKADINQTTEVPIRQITVNGTSTQETFQFKPLTLKLEVTPQVTSDGSVIMKVSVARQFRGADVPGLTGGFAVNSREANTRVLVKNGQTAVIGGIYQSDATDGETGVPWFREIPVVGYLFKTKSVTKDKTELLIFLTPRIMGQVDATASIVPETKDL